MAENKTVYRIDIQGNEELIKLRKELDTYQKSLKKLRGATKDSEQITESQAQEFSNLELSVKKTRSEFNKASKSIKSMNDSTKKGIGFVGKMTAAFTAANLATLAFTKVTQALRNGIVGSVETFREYEFAMSKVKAISGATEEQFLKLDKSAQDLGRSTFFTATEVANLQINFSKLGFTAEETLNAQEAALLTATATGEDLARTATVIGSTLRGFGLDASEAGRVSDVMAASFTSSALDIEKFQTSMTKVAPVAKILGLSLEDTTATLGVLTDSGIEASIAGTSLRNIFLKLGDPSSDLAKSIGFTVNSGEEMVAQFKRMAEEGVNVEKMLKIVDVRQVAAISTMIENIDVLERQIGALENSAGAARDMADIVGKNLEGATKRFNSALDGLRIVLVEKIAPALTTVLNGFTSLISAFTDLNDVPVSEKLESSRLRMNALFETLKDTNTTLSTRKKVIMAINKDYKEYLPNLISEKTTFTQIEQAQKAVNERMLERITLMAAEEKVKEVMASQLDREKELFDLETRRNEVLEEIASGNSRIQQGKFQAINLSENELSIIENTIKKLKEKGSEEQNNIQFFLDKAKELGSQLTLVNGQLVNLGSDDDDDENGDDDDEDKTIINAERIKNEALIKLKTGFNIAYNLLNEQEAGAEETLSRNLKISLEDIERQYFDNRIANLTVGSDEYIALLAQKKQFELDIEKKNAQDKIKIFEQEKDAKIALERAKITAVASGAKAIGSLAKEGSALAKAAFIVEQGAAVAGVVMDGQKEVAALRLGMAKQNALIPFSGNAIYMPQIAAARINTAMSVASILAQTVGGLSGGSGGVRGGERGEGSFSPTVSQFAEGGLTRGGMFKGASHANGGVKFRVGGRIHEAEGGEAIINKRSTARFRPILSAINSYNGNGVKFAEGGLISSGEKFAMGGELRGVQELINGSNGGTQRVVLVESDVTSTQNRVSNIESQATF